jgi:hypothetical protein
VGSLLTVTEDDLDAALAGAVGLLDDGDLAGAMRQLRLVADRTPVEAVAPVVARAAELAGFADLRAAAQAVAGGRRDPQALYDFGYGCIEHGVAYLAVPALTAALRQAPDARGILLELVTAYEHEARHADAVRVLAEHDSVLEPWPDRYLLAFNALLDGDRERAERTFAELTPPADPDWLPAYQRIQRMLHRTRALAGVAPLDRRDLRGWHFALNGGVLGTLSPYGFDAGMTGRFAYLQDGYGTCLRGLHRLRTALAAAGRSPTSVSLLPDRSSAVLGLAAAQVLDLPAQPWTPDRRHTVVVAYDLTDVDPGLLAQLRDRPAGQLLAEHATCWTDPPAVAADFSTLLHQIVVAPWDPQLRADRHGAAPTRGPADERPVQALADEVLRASMEPDDGDGETPADPDEALAAFVRAVADRWASDDQPRDRLWSPGPVPSSRFT